MKVFLKFIIFFLSFNLNGIVIDRLILSSNDDKTYIEFWPHVASWWQNIIKLNNITLMFVGPLNKKLSHEEMVVKVAPIPGVKQGLHAQVIRLLAPCLFPEEVCLIGDIDMIPLNKSFFVDFIKHIPDDHFVVFHQYKDKKGCCLKPDLQGRYPMCYIAGKGKVFADIFKIKNYDDINKKIKQWSTLGKGFCTDELVLFSALNSWEKFETHCTLIDIHPFYSRRIKRNLVYDQQKLKNNFYFDVVCPFPYSKYKQSIDNLVADALDKL